MFSFFFFQAEDGIRDKLVTGVQTCALPISTAATTPNPISGLRFRHTVVIDPGHGGADPGNPGRYFPNGLVEKDITLAIARLLRAELVRRGIAASLTRSTDTLIDLADRGGFCLADCDLFVSIHVNAMPPGRRAVRTSGVRSEEHTSELQSLAYLVCRLLLEKKKKIQHK